MVGRTEQHDRSLGDQHPLLDEILTPDIREALACLALMSEEHLDIADVVAEHAPMLVCQLERHPQFAGPCRAMLIKLVQLNVLHEELAHWVMHHSRLFEDAVVAMGTSGQEHATDHQGDR